MNSWQVTLNSFAVRTRNQPSFCSLSAESDLLSQWRAYCPGGGFSIGFPEDQLREAVIPHDFALAPCVYTTEEQRELIRTIIHDTISEWLANAKWPVDRDDSKHGASSKLGWELIRATARMKNGSFSEERESRIVSTPECRFVWDHLEFRTRKGLIVPYVKVPLPESRDFWNDIEIVIGPTPHPELSRSSVHALLRKCRDGLVVMLKNTQTPFREW